MEMASVQQPLLMINPRPLSYLSLLDVEILIKICEYLDFYELLQIGELDVNYQRIIGERIISKRVLDITSVNKYYDPRHAFRQFGEFATALKIQETDIKYKDPKYTFIGEIFRLVNKRCTVGQLKSIEITLNNESEDHIFNVVPDVFKEIESLTINMHRGSRKYNDFVEKVLTSCKKLNTLTLNGSHDNWDFLGMPQVTSIQSLHFENCLIRFEIWSRFILLGVRKLKTLKISHLIIPNGIMRDNYGQRKTSHHKFISLIAGAFPSLEKFIFVDGPTWQSIFTDINYSALKFLPNLKEVHILKIDRSDVIDSLAKENTIEKLSFCCSGMRNFSCSDIQSLGNLRSISFIAPIVQDIPKFQQFMKLRQLTECTLSLGSCRIDKKIISIFVDSAEYLRALKIDSSKTKIASSFYDAMVKERAKNLPNTEPIHLYARFNSIKRYRPNVIVVHKL